MLTCTGSTGLPIDSEPFKTLVQLVSVSRRGKKRSRKCEENEPLVLLLHFDLTELELAIGNATSSTISSIDQLEKKRVYPLAGYSPLLSLREKIGRTAKLKFGEN